MDDINSRAGQVGYLIDLPAQMLRERAFGLDEDEVRGRVEAISSFVREVRLKEHEG